MKKSKTKGSKTVHEILKNYHDNRNWNFKNCEKISSLKNSLNIIEHNTINVKNIALRRNKSMQNIDLAPIKQTSIDKTSHINNEECKNEKYKEYLSKKTFQFYSEKKLSNYLPKINKPRKINFPFKQNVFDLNKIEQSEYLPKLLPNDKFLLKNKERFKFIRILSIKKLSM